MVPLARLSLCLCAAATSSHCISWFLWLAFPPVCVQQPPAVIAYPALGSSGLPFLMSVQQSPAVIACLALGSSVSPFLVSVCSSHQQSLHSLLLVPLVRLSLCLRAAVTNNHHVTCSWFLQLTNPCICVWWSSAVITVLACRFCSCPTCTGKRSWVLTKWNWCLSCKEPTFHTPPQRATQGCSVSHVRRFCWNNSLKYPWSCVRWWH
jgi:hypothetical protein